MRPTLDSIMFSEGVRDAGGTRGGTRGGDAGENMRNPSAAMAHYSSCHSSRTVCHWSEDRNWRKSKGETPIDDAAWWICSRVIVGSRLIFIPNTSLQGCQTHTELVDELTTGVGASDSSSESESKWVTSSLNVDQNGRLGENLPQKPL